MLISWIDYMPFRGQQDVRHTRGADSCQFIRAKFHGAAEYTVLSGRSQRCAARFRRSSDDRCLQRPIAAANHQGLEELQDRLDQYNLYTIDSWVIMKGSPNKADAESTWCSSTIRKIRKTCHRRFHAAVTDQGVDRLDRQERVCRTSRPRRKNMAGVFINDKFWLENLDKVEVNASTRAVHPHVAELCCAARRCRPRRADPDRRPAKGLSEAARAMMRAAALVLPLFLFLLACFVAPIGAMLARGIIDNDVAPHLPRFRGFAALGWA